jgi:ankyrin repeat protein
MKIRDAIESGDLEAVRQAAAADRSQFAFAIQELWNDRDVPVLKVLLECRPPVYALPSVVANAAGTGQLEALRTVLTHPAALTAESGAWALSNAAAGGHLECLRVLLAAGVDPNHPSPYSISNQKHPLVAAVHRGHVEMVRALIEAGTALDFLIGDEQDTILDRAKAKGDEAIIGLLVAAGAMGRSDDDLDLPGAAGFGKQARVEALLGTSTEGLRGNALKMAAQSGHTAIVERILAAGTPQKERDDALALATQNGHVATAKVLLAAGASPEAELMFGRRALMVAADKKHPEIVALLIAAGADVSARTDDGDDAFSFAEGNEEIVAMLTRAGADPHAKEKMLAAAEAELRKLERTAWRPMVDESGAALLGSRFGGLPWLEEGEAWPRSKEGAPLAFLLQVNLDEAPEEVRAQAGGGLLQLFFDVQEQPYQPFSSGHFVRIVRDAASRKGSVAKAPEGLAPFPEKSIYLWLPVRDTPFREAGETPDHRYPCPIPRQADELSFHLNRKEDKLGGWASWVQDPVYPTVPGTGVELDRLLFQLNSERNVPVMFGDNGVGYIVQSSREPDRVAFLWQSG